ncbi:MAG: hypothetical protein ABIP93_17230 [Gemmatimonadaceae bacterium]
MVGPVDGGKKGDYYLTYFLTFVGREAPTSWSMTITPFADTFAVRRREAAPT